MKTPDSQPEIPPFRSLWPFWLTALAWAVAGVGVNLWAGGPVGQAVFWQLATWLACLLDFAVTAQMLRGMLALRAGSEDLGAAGTRTLAWGVAKLACLALIGVVLWAGQNAPTRALLLGMTTLVVVPLLGGLWWFQKEKSDGERRP